MEISVLAIAERIQLEARLEQLRPAVLQPGRVSRLHDGLHRLVIELGELGH